MNNEFLKSFFYESGVNLEAKSCKILFIMYGLSNENGMVKTSLNDLQQRAGISKSTIRSALKELKDHKILSINHNIGLETEYKLLFVGRD